MIVGRASLSLRKKLGINYSKVLSLERKGKRSRVTSEESGSNISFKIEASDVTAMRSTINSVLRDIKVIEDAATARIPQKPKS